MKLIADSGSTKTDWRAILSSGLTKEWSTEGINPVFMSSETISGIISAELVPGILALGEKVEAIHFYGAGLVSPEIGAPLAEALEKAFPGVPCETASDLLGAARSLCGHQAGIACILGTGSNSCLYDGEKVVSNVRAGGFILGDEGSGAYFGRRLLSDFIKGMMPAPEEKTFKAKFGLDYPAIVQKVYKEPMPGRFLASFMPFMLDQSNHPYYKALLRSGFEEFLTRNISHYEGCRTLPISFTGSVAYYCKDILQKLLATYSLKPGRISRAPMDGLITYHSK